MAISDGQQALSLNQVRLEARCVTASGFFYSPSNFKSTV
jgi:hypothetical protein